METIKGFSLAPSQCERYEFPQASLECEFRIVVRAGRRRVEKGGRHEDVSSAQHCDLLLVVAGCGGAPSTPEPDDSDPNLLSCTAAALASDAGQPLDVVSITGITAPADSLLAARITVGDEELGYAFVQSTPDVTALSVPPHPNGTLEGGEVTLTLTDGETTCEPMLFTIEALPAAPGTTQRAADLMQDTLALQAQLLGSSLEELQAASAQELPPHLLPLFTVHCSPDSRGITQHQLRAGDAGGRLTGSR